MKTLLALLLAGALGTLCRYGLTLLTLPWRGGQNVLGFPCTTILVNAIGCLLAGFCFTWLTMRFPESKGLYLIVMVGFFGAFTTFSSFILDAAFLLKMDQMVYFLIYCFVQMLLGLAMMFTGFVIGRIVAA